MAAGNVQHESLKKYELHGILNTQQVVRSGKYASTIELKFHGLKCVGMKITPGFYEEASSNEQRNIQVNLEYKCELLGSLRHPNIIQFLGVMYETDHMLPMIVTEFLPATLHTTLQKDAVLSDAFKYSILDDVATGLCYLHEHKPNAITHGSLTTKNVLLTSNMIAKISYLGDMSRLSLSRELEYESPTAIDISSFGSMIIEMFREKNNTKQDNLCPESTLHLLSSQQPLRKLTKECINVNTSTALQASEVLDQIRKVRIHSNIPSMEGVGDWQQLVSTIHQLQLDKQTMIEEHRHTAGATSTNSALKAEIESTELSELKAKNSYLEKKIAILSQDLESKTITLEAKNTALAALAAEHNDLMAKAQDMERNLRIKEEEVSLKEEITDITQKKSKLYRDLAVSISNNVPHPLNMKCKLTWKDGADLPFGITAPQHVVMNTDLFVGGGQTDSRESKHIVVHYSLDSNKWDLLPPSPFMHFGLGKLAGKLVTVGGSSEDKDSTVTGKVMEYNPTIKEWVRVIEDMPTPRRRVCVVSYKSSLAVCGGKGRDGNVVASVEVFTQQQWHTACSLPEPRVALGATIKDDRVYFTGGYYPDLRRWEDARNDCPSMELSSLLNHKDAEWNTLAPLPVTCTMLISHYGTLMAIGGLDAYNKTSYSVVRTIFAYNVNTNTWVPVDEVPFERSSMMIASLYNNDIIIVGGWEVENRSKCVKIGTYNLH